MRSKLWLCALVLAVLPLSNAFATLTEIPIELQITITDEQMHEFLSRIPEGWDPVASPMPDWLAPIIDTTLGWVKTYNPDNPLLDPDHPISVTVTNNSSTAWTDFHFDVLPHPQYGGDMSNFSVEETNPPPGSDHPLDGVDVNNVTTPTLGPQVHYWHWTGTKPIQPGDTVNYNFLLHNPDNQPFKLNFYPTLAIPEPGALLLLVGGLALLRRRFR